MVLHYDAMDVGNDGLGVGNAAPKLRYDGMGIYDPPMNVGNEGMGVCNIPMDVRNNQIRIYRKFGLEVNSQRWSRKSDGTYVEDV